MGKIDLPKPEEITDQRYFEIRDCDSDGNGSFQIYCVTGDTTDQEIFDTACDLHTADMGQREQYYIPSMFREPPKWRNALKVLEKKRTIRYWNPEKENERKIMERSGKNYTSDWETKRGGLKFTIENAYLRVTTNRGVHQYNGYRFGHLLMKKAA